MNNNNSGSPYYNNTTTAAPGASPLRQQSPQTVSPQQQSPQIDSKRQKRHYPRFQGSPALQPSAVPGFQQPQQQQFQQFQQPQQFQQSQQYQQPQPQQFQQQFQQAQEQFQTSPQPGINRYASASTQQQPMYNSVGGYNQALNGMASMNINQQQQRQDVSLVGQPAAISDLHRETPTPTIPPQVSTAALST
jgi:hypothetical protein